MAFCGKQNMDFLACLKNTVNFLAPQIYIMNIGGCFANVAHSKFKSLIRLAAQEDFIVM
jgi:hypothetical protein